MLTSLGLMKRGTSGKLMIPTFTLSDAACCRGWRTATLGFCTPAGPESLPALSASAAFSPLVRADGPHSPKKSEHPPTKCTPHSVPYAVNPSLRFITSFSRVKLSLSLRTIISGFVSASPLPLLQGKKSVFWCSETSNRSI